MKRVWLKVGSGLVGALSLVLALGVAPLARADIPQPDSAPTVISIAVYRHLLQPNDTLFRVYYNVPYATTPTSGNATIMVNEAYRWNLKTAANVTVGYNSSFPFHANGYGYNVVSLYFDNSTGITWQGAYTLELTGIAPGFTGAPPSWSFPVVPLSVWDASTTQAEAQAALTADVLDLSAKLDAVWGNNAAASLIFYSEVGAVLSQQGMYFWNNTIPSLQAMAPNAYQIVVGTISTAPGTWTDNYTVELGSQWSSDNATTWLADAQQAGADFFSLDWDLLSVILVFGVGAVITFGNIAMTQDSWNGLMDASVWMIIAARLGLYGLAFLGLIVAICLIYVAMKLWGLR
jgi:hypothetical protein